MSHNLRRIVWYQDYQRCISDTVLPLLPLILVGKILSRYINRVNCKLNGLIPALLANGRKMEKMDHQTSDRYVKDQSNKILRRDMLVPASLEEVWDAWTTTEGVKTFFSSEAMVELVVGGSYEIYFNLKAKEGLRGSEGCKILSYLPMEMLSFEWNAPPDFGELRGQHTRVVLHFKEFEPGKVKVVLSHLGWGKGEDWDKLYDYFGKAWYYVLDNLKKRFTEGPINGSSCC